jgi:hypothetical protein
MYDIGNLIQTRKWLRMVEREREREGITVYKHTSNLVYLPSPPTHLLLNHLKWSQPSNSKSLKLITMANQLKKATSKLHPISRLCVEWMKWEVRSYTITPFLHLFGLMTWYSYPIKDVLTRKTSSMYPQSGIWMLNLETFTPNYLLTMHLHN